jgi:hypothetical protein
LTCALTAEPSGGQATRNEVHPGSRWWVTYGLATNDCTEPIQIRAVDATPSPAAGTTWLGRTSVLVRRVSDPPVYALWPATHPLNARWRTALGASIAAGQQIHLASLIQFTGGDTPRQVPEITVSFTDGSGADGTLRLDPGTAFCSCSLPGGG